MSAPTQSAPGVFIVSFVSICFVGFWFIKGVVEQEAGYEWALAAGVGLFLLLLLNTLIHESRENQGIKS